MARKLQNLNFARLILFLCSATIFGLTMTVPAVAQITLYGTDIQTDSLIVLDLTTGVGTVVGSIAGPPGIDVTNSDVEGIAFNPSTNLFLGMENFTKTLVQFSLTPSGLTPISASSFGGGTNLARNPTDGHFYLVEGSSLFKFDLATLQKTLVGTNSAGNIESLAFAPDGSLYGIDIVGPNRLVRLNPLSGQIVSAVTLSFSGGFTSLAIHPQTGVFYAASLRDLWTIDPASGVVTRIGNTGFGTGFTNVRALDFVAIVPPDTTPPETTITGGPSGTITQTSATFTFTGSDDVTPVGSLVYASRLDPLEPTFSAFGSSTSRSYSNLALGDYTFHVKAQDQAGNEDSAPATRSFTVSQPSDGTPPETTIVSGPSGSITETGATFTFTGSDDVTSVGNLVYASRLSPLEASFTSFGSSTSRIFSDLDLDDYTFQVKARDEAGNEDSTPATRSFTVTEEQQGEDTAPPQTTITSGPLGNITRSNATFTFTGSDNITPIGNLVYASRLVPLEQAFSTFSNSKSRTFLNLAPGEYTFQVKARDQEGNQDPSPATRSFTVIGRILVANFMNGNDAVFNSRIYFWNPSDSSAPITARVFTLPLTGASTLLGTVDLGNLEASSARIIKLAEDILSSLNMPMPYTDNGGNLTIEFTIVGEKVRGVAQVFSSNLAFGTYPLQEIPSTPNASPTVLVANFLNGNNEALNSRVYLWNPSASSAAITVRVFTLLRDGPSTLLGTVDLGLLDAESARNIKIAEDVLFALDIPMPYTDDGGNLTIEFTVDAENVVGVAQVFSDSLAFGTYPMQVIP